MATLSIGTMSLKGIIYLVLAVIGNAKGKIYAGSTRHRQFQFGEDVYSQESILRIENAQELAYDHFSEMLYFASPGSNATGSVRKILDLKKKIIKTVPLSFKSLATALDKETNDVYFGSDHGLYKYDPTFNTTTFVGLSRFNIIKMVFQCGMMGIIEGCKRRIYLLRSEEKKFGPEPDDDIDKCGLNHNKRSEVCTHRVEHKIYVVKRFGHWERVKNVGIDTKNQIHFVLMEGGVYCANHEGTTFKNTKLKDVDLFAIDGDKTYGIQGCQIYQINCVEGTARRVLRLNCPPISFIFGDGGRAFFSTECRLVTLRKNRCTCA